MAIYHRIDQDMLSRKSSHKDTPILVISSGPSSAAAEIIVDIHARTRTT